MVRVSVVVQNTQNLTSCTATIVVPLTVCCCDSQLQPPDTHAPFALRSTYWADVCTHRTLAELMLPDGVHKRDSDWTVFFLNRKNTSNNQQKKEKQQQQKASKNRSSSSVTGSGPSCVASGHKSVNGSGTADTLIRYDRSRLLHGHLVVMSFDASNRTYFTDVLYGAPSPHLLHQSNYYYCSLTSLPWT